MKISWVMLDRICEEERLSGGVLGRLVEHSRRPLRSGAEHLSDEELLDKLRGFGLDLDRRGLEQLCEGALSAEEAARPLIERCRHVHGGTVETNPDWIWICLVTLWRRWWPDKVGLELVDDKVQAGYHELEHSQAAGAATWLDAWSDVLRLCDATGIGSIGEFDDRFPMTQSLYNWSQDLQDALWNAGLHDHTVLQARIAVCQEALSRFPDEDQLMTENRRRALAESYFDLGQTDKAGELFQSWLAADPRWGFGWVGWATCYFYRALGPEDYGRAEELLRRGYSTPYVRDREAIAEWLQAVCEKTDRPREAKEFARQARRLRRQAPAMTVSGKLELADQDDGTALARESMTVSFGGDGLPLDQLPDVMRAVAAKTPGEQAPGEQARPAKVGRNAPCPCGSGKKFKKCCGSPGRPTGDRT
jgi:tetratricopeptide (TPR) repeat protein